MSNDAPKILSAVDAKFGYGKHSVVSVDRFEISRDTITAIYGHNGAGKTTLLKGLAGFLKPQTGRVLLDDQDLSKQTAASRARRGIRYVPQDRGVFPKLTVQENLLVGARSSNLETLAAALDLFPDLKSRLRQKAGSLSGGQRQMLAISIALVSMPNFVLLDEPSTGLAPNVVDQVLSAIKRLHETTAIGVAIVEQNIAKTQQIASNVVLIQLGEVVFSGPPSQLEQHVSLISML